MKKILVALILFSAFGVSAQEKVKWLSLNEALELQKTAPKKIIMDVYTNWCGPCKMLDKNTLQNPDVAAYINKHYYAVKFNGEGEDKINYKGQLYENPEFDPKKTKGRNSAHMFTRYLRVRGYPTIVFFDEASEVIAPLTGYLKHDQLEIYLKMFKDDKHKELKTREQFEEYQKNFKFEFKAK